MLFRSSQSKGLGKKIDLNSRQNKKQLTGKIPQLVSARESSGEDFSGGDQITCQVSEGTHQSDLTHC